MGFLWIYSLDLNIYYEADESGYYKNISLGLGNRMWLHLFGVKFYCR